MAVDIFLSFGVESRTDAQWLAEQLTFAGHSVLMEDAAGTRASRQEVTRSILAADLVLSVVTPQYALGSDGSRIRELAQSLGKQVIAILVGLSSTDGLAAPFAAGDRIDMPGGWDGSQSQRQRVVADILKLATMPQGLDADSARLVTRAVLLYDLEDQQLGHELLRIRPGWRREHPDRGDSADLARILLWTKATMEPHSLVRREYERAMEARMTGFILAAAETPLPPTDALVIPMAEFLTAVKSAPTKPKETSETAKARVEFILSQAHSKNHDCPLDVLNDRICCSSEVGDLLEEAYSLAVAELHEAEFVRLQAVYRYALALRFFGDWRHAIEVIDGELGATHVELHGPEPGDPAPAAAGKAGPRVRARRSQGSGHRGGHQAVPDGLSRAG